MKGYCAGNGQLHQMTMSEVMDTLDCMHDQKIVIIRRSHALLDETEQLGIYPRGGWQVL